MHCLVEHAPRSILILLLLLLRRRVRSDLAGGSRLVHYRPEVLSVHLRRAFVQFYSSCRSVLCLFVGYHTMTIPSKRLAVQASDQGSAVLSTAGFYSFAHPGNSSRRRGHSNETFSILSFSQWQPHLQSVSCPSHTTASPSSPLTSSSPSPNALNCAKIIKSSTIVPKLPINHGKFVHTYSSSKL